MGNTMKLVLVGILVFGILAFIKKIGDAEDENERRRKRDWISAHPELSHDAFVPSASVWMILSK